MKYITYLSPELGVVFVAFSGQLSHASVAKSLGVPLSVIRSAGFISLDEGLLDCYGASQSLNVASAHDDSAIATRYFLK